MSLLNDPAPAGGGQPPAGSGTPPGDGGNQPPAAFDFKPLLPEDIRADKAWDSFKPKDQSEFTQLLAKGYHGQLSVIGKKGLIVPDDKSTPEQRAEFYKALGRPDKPEDYATQLPQGLTEDKLDKTKIAEWKKALHDDGIPKAAAEKLIGKYLSDQWAERQKQEQTIAEWETQTRQQFGQDFDKQLNFAKFAVKTFGDDELVAALDESGFGSHPKFLGMLAKIGQKMGDHQNSGGGGGGGGDSFAVTTPEQAQVAIQAFERDAEKMKALREKNHPNHDAMVKESTELYLKAYPVKPRQ
jgi:hypothetical protein